MHSDGEDFSIAIISPFSICKVLDEFCSSSVVGHVGILQCRQRRCCIAAILGRRYAGGGGGGGDKKYEVGE